MKHVFELVCGASHFSEAISGGGCFEVVHLAKQGIELFPGCGTVAWRGTQFCQCGLDFFKLVFEVRQVFYSSSPAAAPDSGSESSASGWTFCCGCCSSRSRLMAS